MMFKLFMTIGECMLKLNLGCGKKKLDGYINIDNRKEVEPDLCLDVTKGLYQWPNGLFEANSVDEVNADDFLEHIHQDSVIFVIEEIYRVLKPGGVFKSFTPSTCGRGAFQDPTHRSFWNINSWLYFTGGYDQYFIKVKFNILELFDVETDPGRKVIHTVAILQK